MRLPYTGVLGNIRLRIRTFSIFLYIFSDVEFQSENLCFFSLRSLRLEGSKVISLTAEAQSTQR